MSTATGRRLIAMWRHLSTTRPSSVQAVVRDLIGVGRARASRLVADAGAAPVQRDAVSREILARSDNDVPALETQPPQCHSRTTRSSKRTLARPPVEPLASSFVVAGKRSELLVELLDLRGRRSSGACSAMDLSARKVGGSYSSARRSSAIVRYTTASLIPSRSAISRDPGFCASKPTTARSRAVRSPSFSASAGRRATSIAMAPRYL